MNKFLNLVIFNKLIITNLTIMKKVFLILLMALTSGVYAQSSDKEDLEIIQGVYGKSKKELAQDYMAIPESQATVFWKIYDEFEVERKALGKAKVAVINDYAANFANLTDEAADKIAKSGLKNNMDYQKLFSKYYDKYKKAVGAITAAKIIQFENYMQTTVQVEIQDAIPFVGEIEALKTKQ
jgi:hypothetical protein